jgi:hypothetical protein
MGQLVKSPFKMFKCNFFKQNNKEIEALTKLKLAEATDNEIKALLTKMGRVSLMVTEYNASKTFERAVQNTVNEPVFNIISRISFKPAKFNTTYQRASTPAQTMFYCSVIPEPADLEVIKYARITGCFECCDLLRDKKSGDGERDITFSKWVSTERISLLTVVDPKKKYKIKYLNDLVKDYNFYLSKLPVDIRNNTLNWVRFLSKEFTKFVKPTDSHMNYMISAIFSEMAISKGYDGLLYPSVQTAGDGLCVAIKPESMHKLTPILIMQSRLSKKCKKVKIENISFCEVPEGSENFALQPI